MAKGGEGGFRLVFGGCCWLGRVGDFAHNGRRLPVYSKPCCGSIWLFRIVKRRMRFLVKARCRTRRQQSRRQRVIPNGPRAFQLRCLIADALA